MNAHDRPLPNPRICLITPDTFNSHPTLRREADTVRQSGGQVWIVCAGPMVRQSGDGLVIHRLPGRDRFTGNAGRLLGWVAFAVMSALLVLYLRVIRRISVFQLDGPAGCLLPVMIVLRLTGARLLLAMREPGPERIGLAGDGWLGLPRLAAARAGEVLAVRLARVTMTPTREMRDLLGKKGLDVNRITVVADVPDRLPWLPETVSDTQLKVNQIRKEGRRQGLFRMYCRPEEGDSDDLKMVVRTLGRLRQRLPGVQCRLQADAALFPEVAGLAASLRLKSEFTFLGPGSPDQILEEILACDVGLIARAGAIYHHLTIPPELFDFIKLQRPVIAARSSALAGCYPDGGIMYYDPGDETGLAEIVYQVFAHPERSGRRIQAAAETMAAYGWERERKKYAGIYQHLTAGQSRPS